MNAKNKTSNQKNIQLSTNLVNNESNNDLNKDCTDENISTVKYSIATDNETSGKDLGTGQTTGPFLIEKTPTLPMMMQFGPATPHRGNSSQGGKRIPIPPSGMNWPYFQEQALPVVLIQKITW